MTGLHGVDNLNFLLHLTNDPANIEH